MDPIVIGTITGLVCGAITLIYAFSRGRFGLGIGGAFVTLIAGIALGIFGAAPVCGLFIWLSRKRQDAAKESTLFRSS
jgi:hypothetical protein